jgi:hypothetical protein
VSRRRTTSIFIVCDDASHARNKVAKVGRLHLSDRLQITVAGTDYLIGDEIAEGGRPLEWAPKEPYRQRYKFQCKLCGLCVEMRSETALKLANGLVAAGVSRVRLSALAARM